MGPSISKNAIDLTVDMTTDILNRTILNAGTFISAEQVNQTKGCHYKGDVYISQRGAIQISLTTVNQAISDLVSKKQVEIIATQIAESITQNFSLNMSKKISENVAKIMLDVGDKIQNIMETDCTSTFALRQASICEGSTYEGNLIIDQEATFSSIRSCLQQNLATTDLETRLAVTLAQTATTREENALAFLGLIILVIVALILGVAKGGEKIIDKVLDWKFILSIGAVGAIIFTVYMQTRTNPLFDEATEEVKNDNIVEVPYESTTPKTPLSLCLEKGYNSVQYVLIEVPSIGDPTKTQEIKTRDINTPRLKFVAYCRKVSFLCPAEDDKTKSKPYQCGNTVASCCKDGQSCTATGVCSK